MTAVARLLPRAIAVLPRLAIAAPVHWRRRLVAALLVAGVLGSAYFFWIRDLPLFRVQHVQVVGLSAAPDAGRLRAALTEAAKGMTTLHVDESRLEQVVARSAVVHSVSANASFPHGLVIEVTENRPVALISSDGHNVPIAADGTLLKGVDAGSALPTIRTITRVSGRRLHSGPALDRVEVAAAAPPALLPKIASITIQPGRGYVAQFAHGPAVWLGGLARLDYKWAAAAAVLAQPSSQGASYIDVRLPERPVAGGVSAPTTAQAQPQSPAPGAVSGSPSAIPATPSQATATSTPPTTATGAASTSSAPQTTATSPHP